MHKSVMNSSGTLAIIFWQRWSWGISQITSWYLTILFLFHPNYSFFKNQIKFFPKSTHLFPAHFHWTRDKTSLVQCNGECPWKGWSPLAHPSFLASPWQDLLKFFSWQCQNITRHFIWFAVGHNSNDLLEIKRFCEIPQLPCVDPFASSWNTTDESQMLSFVVGLYGVTKGDCRSIFSYGVTTSYFCKCIRVIKEVPTTPHGFCKVSSFMCPLVLH